MAPWMLALVDGCSHVHHCSLSLSNRLVQVLFECRCSDWPSDAVAASIRGSLQPAKGALDSFCNVWRMARFPNAALEHAGRRCYHLVDVSGSRLWWTECRVGDTMGRAAGCLKRAWLRDGCWWLSHVCPLLKPGIWLSRLPSAVAPLRNPSSAFQVILLSNGTSPRRLSAGPSPGACSPWAWDAVV